MYKLGDSHPRLDRQQHGASMRILKHLTRWSAGALRPFPGATRAAEIEENRHIFGASPDLILITDIQGNITRVSPSCEKILGYRPDEMVGRSARAFIHPDDLDPTRAHMRALRRREQARIFEARYRHKDGRIVVLEWTGAWLDAVQQHYFFGRDITAQKRDEATIREYAEREQLFNAAVESSNDAIITKDLDAVITGWNTAAEHLFGYTAEEVIGKSIDIIVPDELRGDVRMIVAKIKAGEKVEHHDTVRVTRDGRRIDVSLSVSPIKSPSGAIIGAAKVARDISARKQAQEALMQSEQMARGIIDTALDAFIQLDDNGNVIDWSPKAEAMFGWSRAEILGHNLRDFIIPPETRVANSRRLAEFLADAAKGAGGRRYESPSLRRDGKIIDTEVSLTALRRGNNYIINGFVRDITDRVQAERDRDRNRDFLDRIIENITVAILVKDARDLRYILVNKAAEELWGLSRIQILGKTAREIFPPATAETIEANDRQLLQSGTGFFTGDHSVITPDNKTRLVTSQRLAIHDQQGMVQYILGVVEDVSERRQIDNQLRQSQKMESIGQLTGGVAHDFNNMLTVITGTIDILADAVRDKPQLAAIAKLISEAADRGAELTGQLLAFARKQPLRPREIDVNALMAESEKLLRRALGEQIDIELRLEKETWPAMADPTQLTTALVNLAVNARDAMPNGGKLTLETGNAVLDTTYIDSNQDAQAGSYVVVAVSDSGSGIPEAIRQRVFEPFFTTKEVGKGTGLGLSMVYGFVKQSNGHIKIYSEEGYGTTFKIYLPRADAVASSGRETPLEAALEGGSETILVVEDNALVLSSVTTQLQSLGYRTLTAANAAAALTIADSGADFDLLFTDVIMPGGMNGRQLAEEMAKRRSPLKLLFTSGYTENAIIHHGRLDPGVHLLAKPYRKADLARMVRRALDESANLPSAAPDRPKAQAS
jgi:PAS domain S-box-containing protein